MFSNLHAIVLSLFGTYLYYTRPALKDDMNVFYHDETCSIMVAFSLSYFVIDTFLVVTHFPRFGGVSMLFHHGFITLAAIAVTAYNQAVIMSVTACLTEYTTMFINQRWFLDKCGYRKSTAYVANGLLIWLLWLIFRVGYSFYLLELLYVRWNDFWSMPLLLGAHFVVQSTNLTVLNMMWFYKITMGIVRVLFKNKKEKHLE
ncbi:5 TM domain-containing transmembrane protein [Acrasis kona]|uniref:5 TM domain-containing transmembrane protein n=1 Tax=Acrasis kona TaxID=1008807 RepID=A0AAW2Z7J0_9EUKA